MINKRKLGGEYEDRAAGYLESIGYKIIKKNYFCKAGEIDIVAKDGEYLSFIEVKYRANAASGFPEEAVDMKKAGRITRSALFYMNSENIPDNTPCRFDVVAILGDEISVIKNAFEAVM